MFDNFEIVKCQQILIYCLLYLSKYYLEEAQQITEKNRKYFEKSLSEQLISEHKIFGRKL